ncbi:MAG: ABC transporter ATP-binding protein [Clostridia bacterium]|nr:ABC transporter ATP-binding protein [Clostridia bacterium]
MIPVLKLNNVTKVYNGKKVVDNLSLMLFEGEIFGFIGPNGAGKSTTIKMICGLTSISSGSIFINGYNIDKNFKKAISNIGAVVETPHLYSYLSGRANLKLFANFYGKSAKQRIPNIIKILKMEEFIDKKVSTYSLGMKQRLGIAQAMLNKPKLLILDEPTNGLDPDGIKDIRNLLVNLAKKDRMTIIISSHNLAELEQICDQIAVIRAGKLLSFRNMTDINKEIDNNQQVCFHVNYPNYAGQQLQNKYKLKVKVAGNTIIVPIKEKHIASVITFLTYKHIKIYKTTKINKSLEQIYFELLQNDSDTELF